MIADSVSCMKYAYRFTESCWALVMKKKNENPELYSF